MQLRTGNARISTYYHGFRLQESDECPHCPGQTGSRRHILALCPAFDKVRKEIYGSGVLRISDEEMLFGEDSTEKLVKFVGKTGNGQDPQSHQTMITMFDRWTRLTRRTEMNNAKGNEK
jgi:hypothetical protein